MKLLVRTECKNCRGSGKCKSIAQQEFEDANDMEHLSLQKYWEFRGKFGKDPLEKDGCISCGGTGVIEQWVDPKKIYYEGMLG